MISLTDKEKIYLEEIINEELKSYLDSGYSIQDDYVVTLRGLLSRLNLKETYPYDKWYREDNDGE